MSNPAAQSRASRILAGLLGAVVRPIGDAVPIHRVDMRIPRLVMDLLSTPLAAGSGATIEPATGRAGGRPLSGEWVRHPRTVSDSAILYLHGGAFIACSPRTHRAITTRLAMTSGAPVFAARYRLAPEHPFPAAAEDAALAYRWLLDCGYAPEQIVVAGDSAGGHLALDLALELRRTGQPAPAGLLLISPMLCPDLALAAPRDAPTPDPLVGPLTAQRLLHRYFATADRDHPRRSLTGCDPAGLPPILVQVGGLEMLAADAEHLTERVQAAGGRCDLQVWPGQVHVFQVGHRFLREGAEALDAAAAFVGKRHTAGRTVGPRVRLEEAA